MKTLLWSVFSADRRSAQAQAIKGEAFGRIPPFFSE